MTMAASATHKRNPLGLAPAASMYSGFGLTPPIGLECVRMDVERSVGTFRSIPLTETRGAAPRLDWLPSMREITPRLGSDVSVFTNMHLCFSGSSSGIQAMWLFLGLSFSVS